MPSPTTQPFTLPTDPVTWALFAAILATGYVFLKARAKTRKDPLKNSPAPFSSLHTQRKVEAQMTDLLVELDKMARQMNGQLDTRAAKLEELLRQADERLVHLDDKLAELKSLENGSLQLPREGSHGTALPMGADEFPGLPASGVLETATSAAFAASIPIDPRHAAICRLSDEGRTTAEISRQVNQPPGEVDLILALRRGGRGR